MKKAASIRWVARKTRGGSMVYMPVGGGKWRTEEVRAAVRSVREAREKTKG